MGWDWIVDKFLIRLICGTGLKLRHAKQLLREHCTHRRTGQDRTGQVGAGWWCSRGRSRTHKEWLAVGLGAEILNLDLCLGKATKSLYSITMEQQPV